MKHDTTFLSIQPDEVVTLDLPVLCSIRGGAGHVVYDINGPMGYGAGGWRPLGQLAPNIVPSLRGDTNRQWPLSVRPKAFR